MNAHVLDSQMEVMSGEKPKQSNDFTKKNVKILNLDEGIKS